MCPSSVRFAKYHAAKTKRGQCNMCRSAEIPKRRKNSSRWRAWPSGRATNRYGDPSSRGDTWRCEEPRESEWRLARRDFWRLRVTPSGFGQRRAAGEFGEGGVANVLEIGDADFAGVEGVASEVAHKGEENHTLAESRIGFSVFAESDEVEDGFSLLGSAIQICSVAAVGAEPVEPIQATTESELIFFVFAGEQIDKFGGAGFDSAARFFVLGDDGLAKRG